MVEAENLALVYLGGIFSSHIGEQTFFWLVLVYDVVDNLLLKIICSGNIVAYEGACDLSPAGRTRLGCQSSRVMARLTVAQVLPA